MRESELGIVEHVRENPGSVGEVADAIDKSPNWTSELISSLDDQHLVEKDHQVRLAETYEATLLAELIEKYAAEKVLAGTKEDIVTVLLDGPQTITDLQRQGFGKSTLYEHLREIQETGVLTETPEGYSIADETLRSFLQARTQKHPFETVYRGNGAVVVETSKDDVDGMPTAFSAFTRYGVDYHSAKYYTYRGDRQLELEDVLMHAVAVADERTQMAMAAIFYLTHRASLDVSELWRLADCWDCVEKWADLFAYIDNRDVHREDRFLPWDEFIELANDYDVYPRDHYPAESLQRGLEELGERLEEPRDVYLLGGGNLIIRELKDATKDIDLVVAEHETFRTIVEALHESGYVERGDLADAYEQLDPSIVLERDASPQWDIFEETVASALQLTPAMRERCDHHETYGNLQVHLLSLTDMFLFKSITEREGDLEDVALIARQGELDWQRLYEEIQTQEDLTGQFFSFAVLETLDVLEDRHDIVSPITDELVSYCLEKGLLVTLAEPKTIEDIRDELDFPDHQLYNKLRKMEDQGRIAVDRSGHLNTYRRTG